ncbi:MAG: hypothetical protein AAF581_15995 [Planctomycetota bacterium]
MNRSRGLFLVALLALSGCNLPLFNSFRRNPQVGPPIDAGTQPDTVEMNGVIESDWPLRGRLYNDVRVETDGTVGADFDVDVSPDGQDLVFASNRHTANSKIWIKRGRQSGLTQKTSGNSRDIQPKFSPDGKRIAFSSNRFGNFDVMVVPSGNASGVMQLTSGDGDEIHPTWSPTGEQIAYCARQPGDKHWDIWIIELDGQRRTRFGPGLYPEWSPDGKWLAFQRPSGRGKGWYGVWIVEVAGGAPREIATYEDRAAIQPSWSPSSQELVYATTSQANSDPSAPPRADNLWVVELDKGKKYQLTEHPAPDYSPAWGLDGRIYFTSYRGASPALWSLKPVAPQTLMGDGDLFDTMGGNP